MAVLVEDYLFIQYLMMFAVSIIFTVLALDREGLITTLVSALCWLVTALLSFIYAPTALGSVIGYMFGVVAFVLMGVFFYAFIKASLDFRNRRFETTAGF